MVLVEDRHLERAENGETELSLIVVRYAGPRHSKAVDTMRGQAHWPGRAPIVDNVGYVALVMDEGLGRLEAMNDVSVSYAPEDIAAALLQKNYLPPNVFGRSMDNRVQERVLDTLGVDFQGIENEEGNRKELRKVADVDDGEDVEEPDEGPDPRVKELNDNWTRNRLLDAATDLGMSSEDTEKSSVTSALKNECAEYLANLEDQSKVNDALEDDDTGEE